MPSPLKFVEKLGPEINPDLELQLRLELIIYVFDFFIKNINTELKLENIKAVKSFLNSYFLSKSKKSKEELLVDLYSMREIMANDNFAECLKFSTGYKEALETNPSKEHASTLNTWKATPISFSKEINVNAPRKINQKAEPWYVRFFQWIIKLFKKPQKKIDISITSENKSNVFFAPEVNPTQELIDSGINAFSATSTRIQTTDSKHPKLNSEILLPDRIKNAELNYEAICEIYTSNLRAFQVDYKKSIVKAELLVKTFSSIKAEVPKAFELASEALFEKFSKPEENVIELLSEALSKSNNPEVLLRAFSNEKASNVLFQIFSKSVKPKLCESLFEAVSNVVSSKTFETFSKEKLFESAALKNKAFQVLQEIYNEQGYNEASRKSQKNPELCSIQREKYTNSLLKKQFYDIRAINFAKNFLSNPSNDYQTNSFKDAIDTFIKEIAQITHFQAKKMKYHGKVLMPYEEKCALDDFSRAQILFQDKYLKFKKTADSEYFEPLLTKLDTWLFDEIVNLVSATFLAPTISNHNQTNYGSFFKTNESKPNSQEVISGSNLNNYTYTSPLTS